MGLSDYQKIRIALDRYQHLIPRKKTPYGEIVGVKCSKAGLHDEGTIIGLGYRRWRCICPKCDPVRFNEYLDAYQRGVRESKSSRPPELPLSSRR